MLTTTTTLSLFWLTANLEDVLATVKSNPGEIDYNTTTTTINNKNNNNNNSNNGNVLPHYPQFPENNGNSVELKMAEFYMKLNSSRLNEDSVMSSIVDEGNDEEEDNSHVYNSSDDHYSQGVVLPIFSRTSNDSYRIPSLQDRGDTGNVGGLTATTSRTMTTISTITIMERSIEIPAYSRFTALICCLIILTLGVLGNCMVPIVIVRTKDMRNSTNIFLINLSLADLLVLSICTPTMLVELNSLPETWRLGYIMCKTVPFIELTVAHASVLTILAISFERYYAICEPLKAGYVCTKTRAILICILTWSMAAIFTSPILGLTEYTHLVYVDGSSVVPVCLTRVLTPWVSGYFLSSIIAFFLLPLIILIVLYGVITRNLVINRGPLIRLRPTKPELSLRARKQVVFMLGTVVISFFLCLLPFRLLTLWIILSPERTLLEIGVERYYNVLYFCRLMLYLNSAINPVLYNIMSTKFRKGFAQLVGELWIRVMKVISCGHSRAGSTNLNNYPKCRNVKMPVAVTTSSNTTNSGTSSATTTSSSVLSRSSQRRSSGTGSDDLNRKRLSHQDSELVAMLPNEMEREEMKRMAVEMVKDNCILEQKDGIQLNKNSSND